MEYDKKIFAENLRKQAAIAGENQPDIAEVLGVTKSAVNAYFMGNKMTRMDRIKKLADHFGCNVSDLVDDKSIEDQVTAVAIPVLGTVPAGVPIEAIQDILGYEEIPKIMADKGGEENERSKRRKPEPLDRHGRVRRNQRETQAQTKELQNQKRGLPLGA